MVTVISNDTEGAMCRRWSQKCTKCTRSADCHWTVLRETAETMLECIKQFRFWYRMVKPSSLLRERNAYLNSPSYYPIPIPTRQAQIYVHIFSRPITIVVLYCTLYSVESKRHTSNTIAKYNYAIQYYWMIQFLVVLHKATNKQLKIHHLFHRYDGILASVTTVPSVLLYHS